jgi:hypothetical protein
MVPLDENAQTYKGEARCFGTNWLSSVPGYSLLPETEAMKQMPSLGS